MRVFKHVLIFCLIIIILISIPGGSSFAQTPESIYVPETGHWIRGAFYTLYKSTPEPLILFGYPITEQIIDPTNGVLTQYFQKARFDQVDGPNGKSVQIASLGELLYAEGAPRVNLSTNNLSCRFFPETNKNVCYAFLQFYENHGEKTIFGYPISELEYQDGRYVQYFQRTRMEWHPERPSGQRVDISELGRIYFDARVGNYSILEPVSVTNSIGIPQKIHANAFVSQALTPANSPQTLFIIVQDERYTPLQGAQALITIISPDGLKQTLHPQPTNRDGITQITFKIPNLKPLDIVKVDVEATYLDFKVNASTWFRTWW